MFENILIKHFPKGIDIWYYILDNEYLVMFGWIFA